jgi:hypothetical protein
MRKRFLPVLFAPLALTAVLVLAAAAPSGAGYDVKGKYYETCACAVSCPCAANATLPTEGHCDAGMLFHIDKGSVEGVPMDGLDIVMVIKSPHGQKVKDSLSKGDMDLVSMYLDDKANDAQKGAMMKLLPALFGTKQMKNQKPPVWASMKLETHGDEAKFEVAGGQKLSMTIENVDVGGETKLAKPKRAGSSNRIVLSNSAPFPFVGDITQGFSKKFTYDDYGVKWEYKDRNAFFGTFSSKGALSGGKKPA